MVEMYMQGEAALGQSLDAEALRVCKALQSRSKQAGIVTPKPEPAMPASASV